MKQYANKHHKMYALAKALKIYPPMAVGLMENLWQWTADEIPDGDIGKCTDEMIAYAMGWDKPRRAHELIEALVKVGFLDRQTFIHGNRSLYIHDWHEHCEASVRKRLARQDLPFANGCRP